MAEGLDDESELSFTRTDRGNDVVFEFSAEGRKCGPFAKDVIINYEKPIRTMCDRLLSGIGTELRYSYRKGVNNNTLYAGGQPRPVFIVDTINALCVNTVIALLSIKLNCFAPLLLLALCKIDEIVTFFPKVIVIRQGKWLRNIVE